MLAEVATLLLNAGANPNMVTTDLGSTPLHITVTQADLASKPKKSKCMETVSLLLKAGTDPRMPDHGGKTALDVAKTRIILNHIGVVKLLESSMAM